MAKLPVEDVVERVEAIPAPANQPDAIEAAALLGTVPEPRITVTKALELYWTLAKEKTLRQERGPTAPLGGAAQEGGEELRRGRRRQGDRQHHPRRHAGLPPALARPDRGGRGHGELGQQGPDPPGRRAEDREHDEAAWAVAAAGRVVLQGGREADAPAVQRGVDQDAAARARRAGRVERPGPRSAARDDQHRLPAVRGRGADGGDDPARLRRAAYLHRTRGTAVEVATMPAA